MARYRLHIAYDGTDFHGWQKQHQPVDLPGTPRVVEGAPAGETTDGRRRRALRTVQEVIEDAVFQAIRVRVPVVGASRTDTGVHARAQTAAFTAPDDRIGPADERLGQAINARLPEDVVVHTCERVHDSFDPISDCLAKGYRYTIRTGREKPLWDRRYVTHVPFALDVEAMRVCAAAIVGKHDFAAFAGASHGKETTVRTVLACDARRVDDVRIVIDVSADGFLYNMVRIIAGTLVDAGRGRLGVEDVQRALATGDRKVTGDTMPPEGLCLMWGRYAEPVGVVGEKMGSGV